MKANVNSANHKTKRARPSRREVLALKPMRNPDLQWSEEDGSVVLTIPRRNDWKTRILNIFVAVPESRRVVLDAVGTHVWLQLDGSNSVEAIGKSLAKRYQLEPREAEISLQQYFRELSRRGYVGFIKS